MNWKDTLIITRFDLRNLVRSAPGVLFLVLYLSAAVQLGTTMVDSAAWLQGGMGGAGRDLMLSGLAKAVKLFLPDDGSVRFLVYERPLAMSAYFIISLFAVPVLVLLLAYNQVSGYVSRGAIRYLVLKTGRLELYLGLFLSNLLYFSLLSGILGLVITVGFVLATPSVSTALVMGYGLQIFLAVWLSAVPLIAFMSLVAALLGSPLGTLFLGVGVYAFVGIAGSIVSKQTEYGRILHYVLPFEAKYWFAYPGAGRFAAAALLMVAYTAAFLAAGWLLLRRRNV